LAALEIQSLLNPYLQSSAPAAVKTVAPVTPAPNVAVSATMTGTASATSPACPKVPNLHAPANRHD
jgi:hypothetical protein